MKYWIAAVLALVLGAGAFFLTKKKDVHHPAVAAVEPALTPAVSNLPNLRRSALQSIRLPHSPRSKPDVDLPANDYEANMGKLPSPCQSPALIKDIVENDLEALVALAKATEAGPQECLKALGGPSECFANPNQKDDYHLCSNNIAIARAKLIDTLTSNNTLDSLDEAVLANKIIARIYSSEQNMDQQSAELFKLSDQLVGLNSDNLEAHNLRSYFSFQILKLKEDAEVLEKSTQSSDFLRRSSDSNLVTLGYIQQFALEVLNFARTNSPESLDRADSIAEQFLVEYPENPKGMIMKSVVHGYRGDLPACKEWTEKALAKGGPTQSGYEEYSQIVKSINDGTFDRKMLGVRISSSEAFIPERIIQ